MELEGDNDLLLMLVGGANGHLRLIETYFNVRLSSRGNTLYMLGEENVLDQVEQVVNGLRQKVAKGLVLSQEEVNNSIIITTNKNDNVLKESIPTERKDSLDLWRQWVTPKTPNQELYLKAISTSDMVFCIGPAGTGKTYLAIVMAVACLINQLQKRIVLVRPAVEAGEKLGYLPGTLYEKINPYMRPLYDSLYDLLGQDRTKQYISRGLIEVAPLAFMRGRTINDAFIILDEAQNTSSEQMKMFLTRMGFGSKMVVTGDITQPDIPQGVVSGLMEATALLSGLKSVPFVYLNQRDVVRHPLVRAVLRAYEGNNGKT